MGPPAFKVVWFVRGKSLFVSEFTPSAPLGSVVPASPDYKPLLRRKTPVIALVGSDGSGKTTVGEALLAWMREQTPTQFCHLGKQTGSWGRAIARVPLVGRKVDNGIAKKASNTRREKGAGSLTALVIFVLSMRRLVRFRKMRRLHKEGYTILTDRYPQAVIPGPMDGPGLVARTPKNGFVKFLTQIEQKVYEHMATFRPDIVLRLNVDLQTALARKPDHRPDALKQKVADVPRLTFNGAPIVELDATQPLEQVLETARTHVAAVLKAYGV